MTNEKLATRAVACEGWQWMPGMLAKTVTGGARVLGGKGDRPVLAAIHHHGNGFMLHHLNRFPCDSFPQSNTAYPYLPDLSDPATLGCLLALVREAWEDPHLHVGRRIAGWGVWTSCSTLAASPLPECVGKGDTEAAALVAALEAAP